MTKRPEPISVPAIADLTYAELDEIEDLTGVDVLNRDVRNGTRMCALEFWARRKAGQAVTFDEVRRASSISNLSIGEAAVPESGKAPVSGTG